MISSLLSPLTNCLLDIAVSCFNASDEICDSSKPLLEGVGSTTSTSSSGTVTPTTKDLSSTINLDSETAGAPPKVFRSNVRVYEKVRSLQLENMDF